MDGLELVLLDLEVYDAILILGSGSYTRFVAKADELLLHISLSLAMDGWGCEPVRRDPIERVRLRAGGRTAARKPKKEGRKGGTATRD